MYQTIQAGLDFLDNSGPAGWWERIDLETFDIMDGDHCVLGQVFRADADVLGYPNGYCMYLHIMEAPWLWDRAFSINDEIPFWTDLQMAWVKAITERRAMVNA